MGSRSSAIEPQKRTLGWQLFPMNPELQQRASISSDIIIANRLATLPQVVWERPHGIRPEAWLSVEGSLQG
jgi:hypothetical protein